VGTGEPHPLQAVDVAEGVQQLGEQRAVPFAGAAGLATPSATRARTSATMSPSLRDFSGPRSSGTMQNVQLLSQPIEIETHAWWRTSRRAGSAEGNISVCSRISTTGSAAESACASRSGRRPMLCVP
jgi:hypothetical protein